MKTVQELLETKGRSVSTIHPEATVFEAIKRMAEEDIGSLVVKENGRLAGIITERIYARNVILKGKSSPNTTVRDIMATHVVCARPDNTVEECMAIMTEKSVRHLPVLEKKELVGLLSIGDLVKSIIDDQKFIIEQLEHYIHS